MESDEIKTHVFLALNRYLPLYIYKSSFFHIWSSLQMFANSRQEFQHLFINILRRKITSNWIDVVWQGTRLWYTIAYSTNSSPGQRKVRFQFWHFFINNRGIQESQWSRKTWATVHVARNIETWNILSDWRFYGNRRQRIRRKLPWVTFMFSTSYSVTITCPSS